MSDFNARIIDEFRANAGKVGGPFEDGDLLLLHTTGARSGEERVNPLAYARQRDTYLVVGSAALLVVSVHQPRWRALLERSPLQWLGMRSYGLYLVHEPLLVALAFLTATTSLRPLFLAGSIGLALVVTALFWRVVEQPSIALSRRAGRWGRAIDDDAGAATPR